MSPLKLLLNDPWLNPYEEVIRKRHLQATQKEQELSDMHGSLP